MEADIDFKFVPIHLPKVEHKLPAFVTLNPYGKVPAWRDSEGYDLYESRAIMRHAAEGTALIPSTRKARALMDQWLWVDSEVFKPAVMPILYMKVRSAGAIHLILLPSSLLVPPPPFLLLPFSSHLPQ